MKNITQNNVYKKEALVSEIWFFNLEGKIYLSKTTYRFENKLCGKLYLNMELVFFRLTH